MSYWSKRTDLKSVGYWSRQDSANHVVTRGEGLAYWPTRADIIALEVA